MNERLTILKGGILRYQYDVNKDIGFDFNTLAEVGEPYQPWFRDEIAKMGLTVAFGVELDAAPWVVDKVVKTKQP